MESELRKALKISYAVYILCLDLLVSRNIPLILLVGMVWCQTFSFKRTNTTSNIDEHVRNIGYNNKRLAGIDSPEIIKSPSQIRMYPNKPLKINGQTYTLIKSDFKNQRLILKKEKNHHSLSFFKEPIDGLLFPWNIIKFPIHNYLQKRKTVELDTLSFDSINSFAYYEKSRGSFRSHIWKGTKYGALQGLILGAFIVADDIKKHGGDSKAQEFKDSSFVTFVFVIYAGAIGAINGIVHGILLPKSSKEYEVGKGKWYVTF